MTQGRRVFRVVLTVLALLVMFGAGWVVAKAGYGSVVKSASLSDLERQFTERLRESAMVGRFTVTGREDRQASPDRYDISSVEKVGDDQWRFNARIRYGSVDTTLPIVVTMKWAGDTPMITLTDFSIPSMGTFTVRVFFYGDLYAGTWQHGKVGGHMFGRIEKQAAAGASGS
jgi:hypothetical protein